MLPFHSILLIVVTTTCWALYLLPSLRIAAGQIWSRFAEEAFGNVCGLIGAVLLTTLIGLNFTLVVLVLGYLLSIAELVNAGTTCARYLATRFWSMLRRHIRR